VFYFRLTRAFSAARTFLRHDTAAGMVEFALSAGLFVVIVVGILEFGLASWSKNGANADAKEGARYAMVHGSTSGRIALPESVTNYVKARTNLGPSIRVYTAWEDGTKAPGTWVKVSVAHSVARRGFFLPAHTDSVSSRMTILY
jgi:Flp pilus assembly protein TadG